MRRSLFILFAVFTLQGCSTLQDSTHQEVDILTPGVIGAECILQNSKNKYRAITPTTVSLQRTSEPLEVVCKKAYYHTRLLTLKAENKTMRSMMRNFWNGVLPGAAYDTASNAVYVFPSVLEVEMEIDQDAVAAGKIGDDDVAEPLRLKRSEAEIYAAEPDAQPSLESISKALRK